MFSTTNNPCLPSKSMSPPIASRGMRG